MNVQSDKREGTTKNRRGKDYIEPYYQEESCFGQILSRECPLQDAIKGMEDLNGIKRRRIQLFDDKRKMKNY